MEAEIWICYKPPAVTYVESGERSEAQSALSDHVAPCTISKAWPHEGTRQICR